MTKISVLVEKLIATCVQTTLLFVRSVPRRTSFIMAHARPAAQMARLSQHQGTLKYARVAPDVKPAKQQ
jgi:hypothetical protein